MVAHSLYTFYHDPILVNPVLVDYNLAFRLPSTELAFQNMHDLLRKLYMVFFHSNRFLLFSNVFVKTFNRFLYNTWLTFRCFLTY